jgi:hypothetical protein
VTTGTCTVGGCAGTVSGVVVAVGHLLSPVQLLPFHEYVIGLPVDGQIVVIGACGVVVLIVVVVAVTGAVVVRDDAVRAALLPHPATTIARPTIGTNNRVACIGQPVIRLVSSIDWSLPTRRQV